MPRKSVLLLTSYRHDILDSTKELIELTTDLDQHVTDLAGMSPEQIRSDKREDHRELFAELRKVYRLIGKQIKKHNHASKQLKEMF